VSKPRERFTIKSGSGEVTIADKGAPDMWYGTEMIPVRILKSRKEIDHLIKQLEQARDQAFQEEGRWGSFIE